MNFRRLLGRLIPVEFQPPSGFPTTLLSAIGYFRLRTWLANGGKTIPDAGLYRPLFAPWEGMADFERVYQLARPHTLVSRDRCYILWRTLKQALRIEGDFVECGVFRGGTALLAASTISQQSGGERKLHLFDSFRGLPSDTNSSERFSAGDFSRTSVSEVSAILSPYPLVSIHPGFIPGTFADAPVRAIAWAHVDVDLYQSVTDCIEWIYPHLAAGGYLIFDDYGFPSCPGARRAVDEAFADKPEVPLCLPTGQCLVVKLPGEVQAFKRFES
ncbi:MAG TPA: TylF/MycF/NovP-related O-methyltransferase [Tepidisphaeraceae bacterium]|nr:TylF/MycF/NovP-related O-methyltransferase [Tepidisphaeraceae bacterium]